MTGHPLQSPGFTVSTKEAPEAGPRYAPDRGSQVLSRSARRRAARDTMCAKLEAAYTRVTKLEAVIAGSSVTEGDSQLVLSLVGRCLACLEN